MNNLIAIVTGPEHNGTTYLSRLLYSIPDIFSGFETGLLLNNDFTKCHPFDKWIHRGGYYWGAPENINFNDTKLSFDDKYKLLFNNKGLHKNKSDIQQLIFNSKFIVDKTPEYIRHLEFVRNNSNNIPILITIKYFREYYISLVIKRHQSINYFMELIKCTIKSLNWIKNTKPINIYLFRYEDIIKPEFGNKLKSILPNKLNLENIDINYDNYLCKINKTDNYTKSVLNIKTPKSLEEIEQTYNKLIDDIKHIF
jgi:hypothetical protein